MHGHRFQNQRGFYRLPQPPAPRPTPGTFIAYPMPLFQGLNAEQRSWQQSVYQLAFEQAQAVVRPSLRERDLLAAWN